MMRNKKEDIGPGRRRRAPRALRRLCISLLLSLCGSAAAYPQGDYPVHVSVRVLPPYGVYLTDYYSAGRDRLVVTLLNRDRQQRPLQVKLRVRVSNGRAFSINSREELYAPMLPLESGVPLRLSGMDLAAYLATEKIRVEGRLREGRLPAGMTEFSVQAVDYATGRALSEWAGARAWIEMKRPPILDMPGKGERVDARTPQRIRFRWTPRHRGLAATEYEFVLKEIPENGADPRGAFAYGTEICRVRTRFTTMDYTGTEPALRPGRRYGWQVRAMARDGTDEAGVFEENGFSEIGWFDLDDGCPAPAEVAAEGGYRKMTVSWKGMPGQREFVVEYRPKSGHGLYEWTRARAFGNAWTAEGLTPGWKYEYRVGALCMGDKPVYSAGGEIALPMEDEERMAKCGVMPEIDPANRTGKEGLAEGEVVIVGRDFPMVVTRASAQGGGWYSGKGRIVLPWIFDVPLAVKFNRLRVNTDNRQIDGEVETETDPDASGIDDANEPDYGGRPTSPAKLVAVAKQLDFALPEAPEGHFNTGTGELVLFDTAGEPHLVATQKNGGESIFPMMVEDAGGDKYRIDAPPAEGGGEAAEGGGAMRKPVITPVRDVPSGFDRKALSAKAEGVVTFSRGEGKYAFDPGREPWYETAQLIRRYYPSLGKNYVAPWKLIPVGESDTVEAALSGAGPDKGKVSFVLGDGTALPAAETEGGWRLKLPAAGAGETYEVFALREGGKGRYETLGKLNVVSYPEQRKAVTLVPVDGEMPDVDRTERELNRIYGPYGVRIAVKADLALKGNKEWDLDGDGLLDLDGSGFFSKETREMGRLRELYEKASAGYDRNACCIFVMAGAKAGDEPDKGLAVRGDMPRGRQFGYVFTADAPDMPGLMAHELGHGLFTLRHSFDVDYSGDKFKGATGNLMDYNGGEDLAAWQWNVMANPAPLTRLDGGKAAMAVKNVSLAGGQNTGIAPDGKVIRDFHSGKEGCQIVCVITNGSYCIRGFCVYTADRKPARTFMWDDKRGDYFDGESSIADSDDVTLTYNTEKKPVYTTIYALVDRCIYRYVEALYDPEYRKVEKPELYKWKVAAVFDASEDCRNDFTRILANDRKKCSPEAVKAGVERIRAAHDQTPQELVNIVNGVCLSALRSLSFDEIKGLIVKIASQETLKEWSELAVLRLMNAIRSKDYPRFYSALEADNNALIIRLVDQMDDVSFFFWISNDNYANFIGALVTMFTNNPESYLDRVGNVGEEKLLAQVFNLNERHFEKDQERPFKNWSLVPLNEFRFSGNYNRRNGTIDVVRKELVYAQLSMSYGGNYLHWLQTAIIAKGISPLTPLLISTENDLPLVAAALDPYGNSDHKVCVIPAIFLKYKGDKELNDALRRSTMNLLDVATIMASGPAILVTKAPWTIRVYALMEVAGALSNIAVNEAAITSPEVREAVDCYNVFMGFLGAANVSKGVVNYARRLPAATRSAIANNANLRNIFSKGYLDWKAAIGRIKHLTAQERKIIEEQAWSSILCSDLLGDKAFINNPNMTDKIRKIIETSETGMGKFVNVNYFASRGAAKAEEIKWMQDFVTEKFPLPKEGETMRKIIEIETMEKWHISPNGKKILNPHLPANGFITKAGDYIIPNKPAELIENLRLDYAGSGFAEDKGFAVIEFKCDGKFKIEHPFNTGRRDDALPYTNTGMTGSRFNVIPEYVNQEKVVFSEGDILKVYDRNGKIIETYKYKKKEWK